MWEDSTRNIPVPLLKTGIAWESDKKIKFSNPSGNLTEAFKNFIKPKAWKLNVWQLDPNNTDNNGFLNEDFIVWMRTAALPTFRKLYRRVDHNISQFTNGLRKANYTLTIEYSKYWLFLFLFQVLQGNKYFVQLLVLLLTNFLI